MTAGWRILVTGGRDWLDRDRTFAALDWCVQTRGPIGCIIHGATSDLRLGRSADWLCEDWAMIWNWNDHTWSDDGPAEMIIELERYPVDHALDGPWPAAGHRRNERMLRMALARGGVDGGIGFPGHKGTQGMLSLLREAGIPVWQPYG